MASSVVIGAYNDDLEASQSPEVSSESSKSDYIMASPIFVLNTLSCIWFFGNWWFLCDLYGDSVLTIILD